MSKSKTRIDIEQAFTKAGINVTGRTAYTDKSKSGWRIKFVSVQLTEVEVKRVRIRLREQFPNQDFRIWYVPPIHPLRGYGGTVVKVFNN